MSERQFPHVVIHASAGTGKTYRLSNRFIALVAAGEQPDRILAATFARKAAGEILDRVLVRLAEAALDADKLEELAEFAGDSQLDRQKCLSLLRKLIGHLHRLRIGTLDNFFAQLAGSYSLELGLPPGWSIIDTLDDRRLRDEAIQHVLEGETTTNLVTLMHLLSKGDASRSVAAEIREVVDALYGLFCETDTAAWESLPRYKQLDADELQRAVDRLASLGDLPGKSHVKARDADLVKIDAGDWSSFVSKGIAAKIIAGEPKYYHKTIEPDVVDAYRPLIDQARAVLLNKVGDQTRATRQLLDKFDAAYQLLKHRSHGLRFEDVTQSLVRGFDTGRIADVDWRLDMQVSHLLLDEFQDTSRLQWQVIRPFAERVTAAGGESSFFCVGDVKQAIYHWRGGVSEIFDAVGDQLDGIEHQSLIKSYRSSQPVIDTVNRVFSGLANNGALAGYPAVTGVWQTRFEPHTTAKSSLPGYCRLITSCRAADGVKQSIATLEFAAERIGIIAGQNPGRTVGVLVRTNSAVARLIYELRTNQQVHASEEGGNPLTDSAAVQLILSLLQIADHPGDSAARFHVSTSTLAEVVGLTQHDDSDTAVRLSLEIRRTLLRDGYGTTIYGWVQSLAEHCDSRDLSRLMQLVELAYSYESDAGVRVDDFIDVVESRRVEDPTAADVRVMTLHQAKGLQFDIVVLPELDVSLTGQTAAVVVGRDGPLEPVGRICRHVNEGIRSLLPAEFRRMFEDRVDQSVNESLCMLYVALTRAVHALHMIIPPSKENEKTLPKRLSGLLRTALTDGTPPDPEELLYEHGDPEPFLAAVSQPIGVAGVDRREPPERGNLGVRCAGPQPPQIDSIDEPASIVVRLRDAVSRRVRGLDRQSPSGLEGGPLQNLADRLRLDKSAAFSRGSLFHAWFEEIEWLDDGGPDDGTLRRIAQRFADAEFNLDAEIDQFRAMLANQAILTTLSRAGYEEPSELGFDADVCEELSAASLRFQVWRERPFAVRIEDFVLKGAIDRLIVLYDGDRPLAADVVDFKTDTIDTSNPAELKSKVDNYRPQLEAYRVAASRLTGLDPTRVSTRLLFVGAGIVCTISARD